MFRCLISISCLLIFTGCAAVNSQIKENYRIQNNYGAKCIQLDLWNEAKIHLKKALEIDKNNASAHNNLGVVNEYFNLKEEAKEAYSKAVALAPQEKVYQRNLASFEVDHNKDRNKEKALKPEEEKRKPEGKLLTNAVIIQRELEPKVKISGLGRIGFFAFFKDEEIKKASQIAVEAFRISIPQETPFYLLEDYEIKDLIEDIEISPATLEKKAKKIQLCQILEADGLFIIQVNNFTDQQRKDFDVTSNYSATDKKFIYENIPIVNRVNTIEVEFWLFDNQGEPLWNAKHTESASTTYKGSAMLVPEHDKGLVTRLMEKPVEDFLVAIRPQKQFYKRMVVLER